MSKVASGNIQSGPPPPYSYGEASPLLDSNLGGGGHEEEDDGGEGGGGGDEGIEGELMRSDQHKNKDFQLISVPKSTVCYSATRQYSENTQGMMPLRGGNGFLGGLSLTINVFCPFFSFFLS